MSKGTIRLPASAITGGRIGTARIREEIAGAARALADPTPTPLDATIAALAGAMALPASRVAADWKAASFAPSPIERMQQLGRLPTGRRNKTEAAYEQLLARRLHCGEILFFRFEAHKLRLGDNTFYTPDFTVIAADGSTEYHEVKGRWTDKARAKTKIAASQFPYRFFAIQRDGRHGWRVEDLTGKSW